MFERKGLSAACVITAFLFAGGAASAISGDLDPAFGVAGIVRTDIGGWDSATDVLVQPDSKVLVAGTIDWNGTRNPFLVRYLADGTLDPAFGSGGKMVLDRYTQAAPRIALQADGAIVLATRSETGPYGVLVFRLNGDGSPDVAFGSGGTAVVLSLSVSSIAGIGVGVDGTISVGARLSLPSGREVVGLARLSSDGSPDGSFGQAGLIAVDTGYSWTPLAFGLDTEGRMLVAGFALVPGRFYTDAFVARFTSQGALDPSFGSGGIALIPHATTATEVQALALQADGKILAGGRAWGPAYYESRWLLARYDDSGALDSGFGAMGIVEFDPSTGHDVILSIQASPAGIYATGQTETLSSGLPVVRFTATGRPDLHFGVGGIAGVPGLPATGYNRLAVQPDENIVVAGSGVTFVPTFAVDVYVARYIPGPTPADTTPPTVTVPPTVVANATSAAGVAVGYEVSATDDLDQSPTVRCTPASGGVFPIGDTHVSCTATDSAGNSMTAGFTIHVKGAAEQLSDLAAAVVGVGPGQSLVSKVRQAQAFLDHGDVAAALGTLRDFLDEVRAQTGKHIPNTSADTLTVTATRIVGVMGG